MSSVVIAGDTSGSITLAAPAVAGTTTLTLPATSGTVLAPSGGILPVASGGTGTATPSLVGGTNITISGTWPNQTVTAAGGGVTSLNGQTGAITNTDYGAIGSYIIAIYMSSADIAANTTVAGSTLGRRFDAPSALNIYKDTNMTNANWATLSLSGTWRVLTGTNISSYSSSYRGSVLAVRIS